MFHETKIMSDCKNYAIKIRIGAWYREYYCSLWKKDNFCSKFTLDLRR